MKHKSQENVVRVASFNIRVGVDSSLACVASDLYSLKADLTAFQELGQHWSLGISLNQCAYLAKAQGHTQYEFMPILRRSWSLDPYQDGPFKFDMVPASNQSSALSFIQHGSETFDNSGYYGIGLSAIGDLCLEQALYLPYVADEQRGAQVFLWSQQGMSQPLRVLNTHLSVNEAERYAQVLVIAKYLRQSTGPLLMLGDFNDLPNSKSVQILKTELELENLAASFVGSLTKSSARSLAKSTGLAEEYSFSVKDPHCRIDHILGRGLKVHGFAVAQHIKSSDHFPIWADISW